MVRLRKVSGDSKRVADADSVAVIGLGRFGRSLALELMAA
ncbi:MAG: TrkA family potassium uptake protein, partial [Salinibacterium sp.]|nr:TrkA family potassium uptake protein [Salinibacterium sp.]